MTRNHAISRPTDATTHFHSLDVVRQEASKGSNCIFALPRCHFNLYKRSFLLQSLFEDAY